MLGVFFLSLLVFLFFKVYGFFVGQQIQDQQQVLSDQQQIETSYKSLTGYNKLQAVKLLERKQSDIPRSDRINKVIKMLEDLKSVPWSSSDSIILSDFKVSLEKIGLKWQVSNLMLLYYSNPGKNILSLLDRFSQIDFIKDIRVQTYDKIDDSWFFEFVLEANVVNDGNSQ